MGLVYVAAVLAFFLIVGVLWGQRKVNKARRQGLYPAKGKTTMEDVRRLALSGETDLAIRAYCELHHVNLKEAKRAVEQMASPSEKTEVSP